MRTDSLPPEPVSGAASPTRLRGLGPKSRALLAQLGLHDAQALRQQDPYRVYAQLKQLDPGTSLNMLYALIGAIEDLDWREVARTRRTEILLRLDDLGLAPR